MYFTLTAALLSLALFGSMLGVYLAGRRLRVRHLAAGAEREIAGAGIVEGAVFALLGLLLAFTFAGAASRFDDRRKMMQAWADLLDGMTGGNVVPIKVAKAA